MDKQFTVKQIGIVKKDVSGNHILIDEKYIDGLLELDKYSHIHVVWWALDNEESRNTLVTDIPYAEDVEAGVFACRSPERPNLIMNTICPLKGLNIKKGKIFIGNIDAFPETPVIDIKPYINVVDRVKNSKTPNWIPSEWGEWMPKNGIN